MRKEKLRPPSRVKKGAVWGEEKPRRACGCASTPHGVLLSKSRKRGRIIVAEEIMQKERTSEEEARAPEMRGYTAVWVHPENGQEVVWERGLMALPAPLSGS